MGLMAYWAYGWPLNSAGELIRSRQKLMVRRVSILSNWMVHCPLFTLQDAETAAQLGFLLMECIWVSNFMKLAEVDHISKSDPNCNLPTRLVCTCLGAGIAWVGYMFILLRYHVPTFVIPTVYVQIWRFTYDLCPTTCRLSVVMFIVAVHFMSMCFHTCVS